MIENSQDALHFKSFKFIDGKVHTLPIQYFGIIDSTLELTGDYTLNETEISGGYYSNKNIMNFNSKSLYLLIPPQQIKVTLDNKLKLNVDSSDFEYKPFKKYYISYSGSKVEHYLNSAENNEYPELHFYRQDNSRESIYHYLMSNCKGINQYLHIYDEYNKTIIRSFSDGVFPIIIDSVPAYAKIELDTSIQDKVKGEILPFKADKVSLVGNNDQDVEANISSLSDERNIFNLDGISTAFYITSKGGADIKGKIKSLNLDNSGNISITNSYFYTEVKDIDVIVNSDNYSTIPNIKISGDVENPTINKYHISFSYSSINENTTIELVNGVKQISEYTEECVNCEELDIKTNMKFSNNKLILELMTKTPDSSTEGGSGSSTGLIIGITIGVIIFVIIVIVLAYFLYRRRKYEVKSNMNEILVSSQLV